MRQDIKILCPWAVDGPYDDVGRPICPDADFIHCFLRQNYKPDDYRKVMQETIIALLSSGL